jgi:hypothetical protein
MSTYFNDNINDDCRCILAMPTYFDGNIFDHRILIYICSIVFLLEAHVRKVKPEGSRIRMRLGLQQLALLIFPSRKHH